VRWAWLRPSGPRDRASESSTLRCVVRLRRWFGAERGDCLQWSLALYRMLSRAGSNPTLVVGVRRDGSGMTGHAWVELNDARVLELPSSDQRFERVCAFGAGGRLRQVAAADDGPPPPRGGS
jgi:hypothetical protein